MTKIHPSAIISPRAELADDVEIGPYTVIDENVKIAAGCQISSSVRIHSGVRLAKGVRIFHGSAIGGEPQDLKFSGEYTEVFVGENTTIREFVTVSRGTKSTGRTTIGENCLLMAYSHVAHDCTVGNNVILVNAVNIAGHVEIEDYAIIGGLVPVHQFVRIGRHCMVGGGYRVPKDIPPYIMAGGYPLHYCGLNAVGLRRRGFSTESRTNLKRAYHLLFQSELNVSQAIGLIRSEFPNCEEVGHVLDFVSKSKRGLLPGNRTALTDEDEQ